MTIDTYMHNTILDVTNLISFLKTGNKKNPWKSLFFSPSFEFFLPRCKILPKEKKNNAPETIVEGVLNFSKALVCGFYTA
jgi:hypothetical protein